MSTSVPPPGWGQQGQRADRVLPAAGPVAQAPRAKPRFRLATGAGLLAVLAGAALLLLGSAGPGLDPIAQAAALSAQSPGYRMHMTLEISSPLLPTVMRANADAVVDLRDRASSIAMVMNLPDLPQVTGALGGDTLTMDMRIEGAVVYVKLPAALAARLPYDKPWLRLDAGRLPSSEGLPGLASMFNNPVSSDPTRQLSYLRAASGDVVNDGAQAVDGVVTTHYHANIDLSRLADAVPPAERGAMSQVMSKFRALFRTDQIPVDVWIDHQHHVRRMTMNMSLAVPGGQAIEESMTADMTDYGPQPRPTLPPAGQVQDITGTAGL